jgi:dTDP-4-dehydrorhamnose 3,5-epimerase
MEYSPTKIKDVLLIKPSIFTDDRGYFFESFRQSHFREAGLNIQFVQDNVSYSRQNVLRGFHYQIGNPQDKLVMAMRGEIMDTAVDLRRSSPAFGKAVSCILSAENHYQMFIPKGFAHGFLVRSASALIYYKCSDYYNPEGERGLKWDDPALPVNWNIKKPILSQKDEQNPLLANIPEHDLF